MSKILKDYKLLQLNYPTEVTRNIYRIKDQHTFNERFKDRTFLGRINYPNKSKSTISYVYNVLHLDTSAISVNNVKIIDNWLVGDVTILDTEEGLQIHNLSDYEYNVIPITFIQYIGKYPIVNDNYRVIQEVEDIIKFDVYLTLHEHHNYLEQTKDLFDYYPEDEWVLLN